MSRITAFLIHLGISFLTLLVLFYITAYHWYPGFLFTDDGGWQWMRLIASIALILGPLLTLILFKPGKRGLKFDIWMISILQVVFLGWTIWATYNERPYAIVFADYYFRPLTKYQFINSKASPKSLLSSCPTSPCMVYSNFSQDRDKLNNIRLKALQTGTPIHMFGEYYQAFTPGSILDIKKVNIDLTDLLIKNLIERKIPYNVREKIISYQKKSNSLMFFPVSSRYKESIAVFDPKSYEIIDTIDHDLRNYK